MQRFRFPALVAVLALFCVQSVQLLSSVVQQDLATPPLVEVPAIDLPSSPVPTRPAAPLATVDRRTDVLGVVVTDDAPTTAAPMAAPLPVVAATVAAPVVAAGDIAAAAADVPSVLAGPATLEVRTATAFDDDGERKTRGSRGRQVARGRPDFVPPGPPPGRPRLERNGCDDEPGHRAACDRKPTQP